MALLRDLCNENKEDTDISAISASHVVLSTTHTDTLAAAVARGSILIGNATPKWSRLTIGASGYVPLSDGNDISWGQIANAGVATAAAIAWSKMAALASGHVLVGNAEGVATDVAVSGVIAMSNTGGTSFTVGAIFNDAVNDMAGITVGKLAIATGSIMIGTAGLGSTLDAKGNGYIMIGNGTTATSVAVTGDITLSNAGLVGITAGAIVDADVNAAAAIVESKLAFSVSGHDHNGITSALVSAGIASNLANNVTCEAGLNDYTLAFGTAGGAYILTIPAVGGGRTFAFVNEAQTITAMQIVQYGNLKLGDNDNAQTLQILVNENMTGDKTLTYKPNDGSREISLKGNVTLSGALITVGDDSITLTSSAATNVTLPTTGTLATLAGTEILDAKTLTAPRILTADGIFDGGGDELLKFVEDAAPVTYVQITSAATTLAPIISGAGEVNTGLRLKGLGTGNVTICDGATIGKMVSFSIVGAADAKTSTLTFAHQDNRVITFPDATDTLVGKATTDTLTNKTLDCDGTGNTLTNVNAEELDSVPVTAGTATKGVPFMYTLSVTNVGGDATIIANPGFKFVILDAWSINESADGGTWQLKNVTSATFISNQVTVAANDQDIDRVSQIDNAQYDIGAAETLGVTCSAALDAKICVLCMRSD